MSKLLARSRSVNYPDSVRFLYALGNELKVGAKWDLHRMQTLLVALGNPESGQRFVHVAGTNGKGSTSVMIASVLHAAGLRTGLYTSPHLVSPTERIQINNTAISPDDFASEFEIVHAAAEVLIEQGSIDAHPSYFETVTAMALHVFRHTCEISVLEVGLGGRLDATNVVQPELCIITPIAFDHESFLGNTIEAIAAEKAGILKPGVPVVIAEQNAPARTVILDRTKELHCDVIHAPPPDRTEVSIEGATLTFGQTSFKCPLPGRHQIQNCATAIAACRFLRISDSDIQIGIQQSHWPGRLERLERHPDLILDGAHNPAGAAALAAYIREFYAGRQVWLVYGAMRDKAIEEVTSQLFPLADRLILTAPDLPRALRPEAALDVTAHPHSTIAATVAQAVELARKAPRDTAVFFTGSLFLVGEARALLVPQIQIVP